MKSIIIYFSNFGSTKKIALALYRGMKEAVDECKIVEMKKVDPVELVNYDLIGLGSPVWRNDMPVHVQHFLDYAFGASLKGKHCFFYCTHGALVGGFFRTGILAMQSKGLIPIGWKDWYGSNYQQYMAHPYNTHGHPDEIDLKEAEDFAKEMADLSRRISKGEKELLPAIPQTEEEWVEQYGRTYERYEHPADEVEPMDVQFRINPDKCNHCGICAEKCPSHSIEIIYDPPYMKITCAKCFLCESICPTGAIEADFEPVYLAMRKYARPNVEKQFAGDIAKGKFRPLLSNNQVGWDTPLYKKNEHPRLKFDKDGLLDYSQ